MIERKAAASEIIASTETVQIMIIDAFDVILCNRKRYTKRLTHPTQRTSLQ